MCAYLHTWWGVDRRTTLCIHFYGTQVHMIGFFLTCCGQKYKARRNNIYRVYIIWTKEENIEN